MKRLSFNPLKRVSAHTSPSLKNSEDAEPLESIITTLVHCLLDRSLPPVTREMLLTHFLVSQASVSGGRLACACVFAMLDEIAPGVGKAARAYFEGLPATSSGWDGLLFDAGVPMAMEAALNPSPLNLLRV